LKKNLILAGVALSVDKVFRQKQNSKPILFKFNSKKIIGFNTLRNLILMLFISFSPLISKAQWITVDSLFWVLAVDSSAEMGREGFTKNENLNNLLNQYNVISYEQVLPWPETSDKLKRLFQIECDCNIDTLMSELRIQFPTLFDGMKRLDYENIALYEPADYMWYLTSQEPDGWLWFLKKIQADLAWDITTGDPNVVTHVMDTYFDLSHPDLASKFVLDYDPYDNQVYTCAYAASFNGHGTAVAGFIAGETTETGGTPAGQLASIGFNTKMIGYKAWVNRGQYMQRAYYASIVMGAKILTSSAGGWGNCPDSSGLEQIMVKEILDNGTTIIMPAGNGWGGTHNGSSSFTDTFCPDFFPPNTLGAFFPLSPYYDERIIVISSTGKDDKHLYQHPQGYEWTHSHFSDVDLCAPGYEMIGATPTNCGANPWAYHGPATGTSFAAPIVAGTTALMYSVNPCLSPSWVQDILKNTTDSIVDANDYKGLVGTGRLNAYQAVKTAQGAHSTTLDLFIKDRLEDFGDEVYPYHWQADRDESPDIWVRNQPDGLTNHTNQEPEYSSSSPVYVYVRVRNKSCVSSTGNEKLRLYWSKASSWSSWPQNWDGTDPAIGNLIGTASLDSLLPGNEVIIEFEWNILNPYIYQNWATCLLARIEDSNVDPITVYPGRADNDVYFNNNIALRNTTIVDVAPGIAPPGIINGVFFPNGKYMFLGNVQNQAQTFDIEFSDRDRNNPITNKAEVKLIFENDGWEILQPYFLNSTDFKIVAEREVVLMKDRCRLENVEFPANVRVPVYVGFSFLTREIDSSDHFKFDVRQYFANSDSIIGGEHFSINHYLRLPFYANAGNNRQIRNGENTMLSALEIPENALYMWYDSEGNLIYTGKDLTVSPEVTEKYKLEVISLEDGAKDYDEVEILVKNNFITSISPNPATSQVSVSYKTKDVESAYLMIYNQTATQSIQYILNTDNESISLENLSLNPGSYTVVLICDGVATDAESLIIY